MWRGSKGMFAITLNTLELQQHCKGNLSVEKNMATCCEMKAIVYAHEMPLTIQKSTL